MRGAIPPFPRYVFMAWCLVKHRDNFTFYILLNMITLIWNGFQYEEDRVFSDLIRSDRLCNSGVLSAITVLWRWATGWTIGVPGFDSRRGLGIFLFTTATGMSLGPTQPPIQWVSGALSLGVKRPWRETTHLHLVPRSKNEWSYTSTPPICLHGVVLS
jgi:hypothetical protein